MGKRAATGAGGEDDGAAYLATIIATLRTTLERFRASGNHGNPPRELRKILARASRMLPNEANPDEVCAHTCASHATILDPAKWGALPKEITRKVFARLPVESLSAVRLLSKEWRAEFADPAGEFLQECDRVHRMVALLTRVERAPNHFLVRLLDMKDKQWHAFTTTAGDMTADDITAASASAGLVCFVSSKRKAKSRSFVVDVVNPLLQQSSALPVLTSFAALEMVEIRARAAGYSVLAVGSGKTKGLVFESAVSARWRGAPKTKSVRYGYEFPFGKLRPSRKQDNPCGFNLRAQTLQRVVRARGDGARVCSQALVENRLYVLHKDRCGPAAAPTVYIVEHELKAEAVALVQVGLIRCEPFETPPKGKFELTLFACEGFLMVLARLLERPAYAHQLGWLCDLATRQWCCLPSLPGHLPYHVADMMCRLCWNVGV